MKSQGIFNKGVAGRVVGGYCCWRAPINRDFTLLRASGIFCFTTENTEDHREKILKRSKESEIRSVLILDCRLVVMFVRSVFEGIRSGVCECVHRKRFLTPPMKPDLSTVNFVVLRFLFH